MKYLSANNNKEHILKLIDLLYNECLSAGGDGDALWYSRYYDVNDILPLVQEYNSKLKWPWKIELKDTHINWGDNQEWITITNSEEYYDASPFWIQMKIRY
jgi:hypothetical protein